MAMESKPGSSAPEAIGIRYGLQKGKRVTLEKVAEHSASGIVAGTVIEGALLEDVAQGSQIRLDSGANTTSVSSIDIRDGEVLIRTQTSTYRLKREKPGAPESAEFFIDDVAMVETAKGSTYRYLRDGKTQRFKKAENAEKAPQDVLVYVPDYAWMQQHAPREMLAKLGKDEYSYTIRLLEYVQNPYKEGTRTYVVDEKGTRLNSADDLRKAGKNVYLALLTGDRTDFFLPVTQKPKIGFMTYDTRHYDDPQTGEPMRERHLGNQVVRIVLKDGREIS